MGTKLRDYDGTLARMAGNIAAGLAAHFLDLSLEGQEAFLAAVRGRMAVFVIEDVIAVVSVDLAERILAEVKQREAVRSDSREPQA